MSDQYFHFTLGPVQSFVAQARRTRDFWAGSFLLSYLSAIAIKAVEKQGGTLIFPTVEENYLAWLEKTGKGSPPQQGCIPNRFKGGTAKIREGFEPELIEKSIKQAWQGLAQKVWEKDLKQCGEKTKEIWDRQVNDFWEMSWVITDEENQSDLLDRRKNWRSYLPPEEHGVKCMMMDGWQELSGIETPHSEGLAMFWDTLRKRSDSLSNDLREGEYLSAIAFIKRRFSHIFENYKQELPGGWTVHGWRVNSSVPSVSYMAAVPWIAEVIENAPEQQLNDFYQSAVKLVGNYGRTCIEIACIRQALTDRGSTRQLEDFKSLDGDVFFESALENKNRHPDQEKTKPVKAALKALTRETDLGAVSPFYAVLMMDGDSLGVQMGVLAKQQAISRSLKAFTKGVAGTVEKYSGFLIYAGGDDVLALLPLEKALNCAQALRTDYLACFAKSGGYGEGASKGQIKSTLSGAIEYAHIKMPLGKVLADAHHLLDDVAKDEYGRDSIAVRVWKPGGQHLQWAMPWQLAIENNEVILDSLANDFRKTEKQTPFSSSFFFNIEARFAMLQSKNTDGKWQMAEGFNAQSITRLIAVEYLNSGVTQVTIEQAEKHIAPLIKQCMPEKRMFKEGKEDTFEPMHRLNVDAAHLVRFLANKGIDHG